MPRIYLAGPIGGMSYKKSNEWRDDVLVELKECGIDCYSPLRGKEFLEKERKICNNPQHYGTSPLATTKGIMTRDHNDCVKADALLINFKGIKKPSIGTAMEMAWAYDKHIPIVVVCEEDNPNIMHPMVAETVHYRVDTMEEGIELIKLILLPS